MAVILINEKKQTYELKRGHNLDGYYLTQCDFRSEKHSHTKPQLNSPSCCLNSLMSPTIQSAARPHPQHN